MPCSIRGFFATGRARIAVWELFLLSAAFRQRSLWDKQAHSFAAQYAYTLNKTCGMSVIISDRDVIIACAGVSKKEYNEKKISGEIEDVIESRNMYINNGDNSFPIIEDGGSHFVSCAMPIISEGDIVGCVASLLQNDPTSNTSLSKDVEIKLIQTAASFLGKQLEA